jgi:hypothetical protein
MSIIDKLKSVFIVPDSASEAAGENAAGQEKATGNNEAEVKMKVVDVPMESSEKFIDILSKVLESNNQPGFDYLEYKKAVLSIAKLQNLEESAQFKTAYAAAMSMNVQPQQLTDSAKRYLMILETEFTKFNQTASQFLQNQVGAKELESSELKKTIQQKEAQLKQLQLELEKHHKRMNDIESELESAKIKVDTNKASFKLAYDQLVGQIRTDIQKMEQYLK